MSDVSDETTTSLPAPPPPGSFAVPVRLTEMPRPGDLTFGWRVATALAWIGVVIGFASVWNASVQIGLSTWWLGPRGEPQPRVVQFLPFVSPALMLLATINRMRWLPMFGFAAAAATAAIAVGDVGTVDRFAIVEFALAGAAAVVSAASLSGMFRTAADEPSAAPERA